MHILITYDISTETKSGTRRLRKIAQICLNVGQRVQKSVFECQVNDVQYRQVLHDLALEMNTKEDSIRVYRLRDFGDTTVIHMGRNEPLDFDEPLVF